MTPVTDIAAPVSRTDAAIPLDDRLPTSAPTTANAELVVVETAAATQKREVLQAQRQQDRELIEQAYSAKHFQWWNLSPVIVVWIAGMHLGALVAPFFFTWTALATCVVLHWFTASVGICLGFHRYTSHRSLRLAWPAEFLVLLAGVLAGEGSPLTWAAIHRLHHAESDQDGDPHSPLDGPWWSHLWWMFGARSAEQKAALYRRFTPDLVDRPLMQFFERTYSLWLMGSGVVLYLLGGWPLLLWGLCVRMVFAYHSTWFVNSATHLWGYRNYTTRDESRNLWWVALLSYGEGWHNNHHAYPSLARAGHRWWEIDMTWWSIKFLRAFGLAYQVQDRIPKPEPQETV